ncbi:MAG: pilus assembly protein PilP [Pasteurella oralis]|uniref:pilus assembly protein PilP n=1 Tax=Pasteurella oralis TaxID=1071947 RepID=UPI00270BAEB1|nr:pilus assembly protein PilP [Pasteurella oralis]
MQKLTALVVFSFVLSVQADPFDRTQRQEQRHVVLKTEKSMLLTSCNIAQSALFPTDSLDELKLIGVLQQQTEWQALFVNAGKQLQSASLNQLLTPEGFLIQQISKQGVTLTYWKNKQSCTDSATLFIKL